MNNSTSQLDLQEVETAFQKLRDDFPELPLDIIVLTTAEYVALRKEFDVKWSPVPPDPFRICGLPVEWYPSREEVLERARDLCDKGQRVGVIRDPERPKPSLCKNDFSS